MNLNLEFINTKSREIKKQADISPVAMTLTERGMYFTKRAAELFQFGNDKYIHFAQGKDQKKKPNGYWYFVVNEDKEGFKLSRASHDAYIVCNRALLRLFKQSTGKKIGDMFYLNETESTLNECPVIEIMLNKTVQELLKQA